MIDTLQKAKGRQNRLAELHRRARDWGSLRWLIAYTIFAASSSVLLAATGSPSQASLVAAVAPALAYGVGMALLTAAVVLHAFYLGRRSK